MQLASLPIRLGALIIDNVILWAVGGIVGSIIGEPLEVHGMASGDELRHRVEALLERCGLWRAAADRYPHEVRGGQRQRIALARAILRDPAILILDEATSQIDVESEQLIQRALEKFVQGRTTIIITHRLAAVQTADRVILLQDGSIVADGTHGELLPRCEAYRRLFSLQFEELRVSA